MNCRLFSKGMAAAFAPSFDVDPAASGGGAGTVVGDPPAAPAQGDGQPPAGAGAGAAPSSPSDGSQPPAEPEHEVTIDGQKTKVKLSELLSGYSRNSDYTKKTQGLAAERKKWESERDTFVNNEVNKRLAALRTQQPKPGNGEPKDPGQQALSAVEQLKAEMLDEKLNAALSAIKGKYPGVHEQVLMFEATKRGVQQFEDLEPIAKELHEAWEAERSSWLEKVMGDEKHPSTAKFKEAIIAAYLKDKANDGKPKHISGGGGAPGGAGAPKKPANLDEADKLALETLKAATR